MSEVEKKATYKQVECERRYLYAEGMYREVRMDTGEVILERKLFEYEKQMDLPFDEQPTDES